MGEGGPRPERGAPWREQPVQFDRRGRARHDGAALAGGHVRVAQPRRRSCSAPAGWGLFVATPWVQVDLRDAESRRVPSGRPRRGRACRTSGTSSRTSGKGLPPAVRRRPGALRRLRVRRPRPGRPRMKDFSAITGPRRDAAEVGARLHAVAPDARRRSPAAVDRRHVPRRSGSRSTPSSTSAPASRRAAGTPSSRRSRSTRTSSRATRRRSSPTCTRAT